MILVLNRTWFVLISCSPDCPQLTFTVRPWVKTGLSLHGLPSPVLADAPKEKPSVTIRLVGSHSRLDADTPHSSRPGSAPSTRSTPTLSAHPHVSASHPDPMQDRLTPERRTPRAELFRPRDETWNQNQNQTHSSPQTPSMGRARGKTVPLLRGSPRTPESGGRADSALSWTPSTSSKHLASWFSGLLGR